MMKKTRTIEKLFAKINPASQDVLSGYELLLNLVYH